MIKMKHYLLYWLCSVSLLANAYAQKNVDPDTYAFMTLRDVQNNAVSNISIINQTSQSILVSGLYISSYDVNDCSACSGSIIGGDNVGGVVVSPLSFKVNQATPIGQNYLYNMIYNGITFITSNVVSPCALPGCSWPGDDPNITGWCISINVMSLNSSYTGSTFTNGTNPPASAAPFGAAGNSNAFHYKYALIDPNTLGVLSACLGPVVCNDKTLTCTTATAQSESFQPYV